MAIPQLRLTRGRIVFTSSGAATSGTTGWGFYGASKAALNHLNMTIAKEEQDIVTVAIRPGMVDTQMQEDLRSYHTETLGPKEAERFIEAHKQGKLLRPEQPGYVIAKLILGATRDLSGKFMTYVYKEESPGAHMAIDYGS
jgi:NAD(P)-dependent dehydrogenase (short-subunit alcohol dehydrogenase family)